MFTNNSPIITKNSQLSYGHFSASVAPLPHYLNKKFCEILRDETKEKSLQNWRWLSSPKKPTSEGEKRTLIRPTMLELLLCSKLQMLNWMLPGISSRCDSCLWNVWCLVGTIGKVVCLNTCKQNTKFASCFLLIRSVHAAAPLSFNAEGRLLRLQL